MNKLTVTKVVVVDNRLTVDFKCEGQIRKFFNFDTKFIAEYNTSIQNVPEAILIIPFLATVAPIAWANQAEIFVNEVDETFLQSLEQVNSTLKRFYPVINFVNIIHAKKVVRSKCETITRRSMALFSGGIDSLTTFIRHQEENPILVSIEDSRLSSRLGNSKDLGYMNISSRYISKMFNTIGPEMRIIKSNWMYLPNAFSLETYTERLSGRWYLRVMHGLALLGLCAPLTYIEKIDTLYIASSYTAEAEIPWGSHPDIDNNVKWSCVNCIHDGYELSRQEKMFVIADFIKKTEPNINIIACNDFSARDRVGVGKNCNQCEKCLRTILGLEIAGINPDNHGFVINSSTFSVIRKKLEERTWAFGDDEVFMWTDLQKHCLDILNLPHAEAKTFINWFIKLDIPNLRAKSANKTHIPPFVLSFPFIVLKIIEKIYYVLIIRLLSKIPGIKQLS